MLQQINVIDVALGLVLVFCIIAGWYRGFIAGCADVAVWLGGLFAGLRFYPLVASWLAKYLGVGEPWSLPIGFMLSAFVGGMLIYLLFSILLRRIPSRTHESFINRIAGTIPGLINGIIIIVTIVPLLMVLPLTGGLARSFQESKFANTVAIASGRIESVLHPVFDGAIRRTMNVLTARPEPESNETVKLPFTVQNAVPRPDLEAQMLALVNSERAKADLKPLVADTALTDVARKHSKDMFDRGYFSHYSPEGKSPFDRMHSAGVSFSFAGENLALAPTLPVAHDGLMNSPGHRANILRKQFGRVGIGILDGGIRGLMISQEFRD